MPTVIHAGKTIKVVMTGIGNYSEIFEYSAGPITPKIIEGNDQTVDKDVLAKDGLSMRFNGAVDLVTKVTLSVNGIRRVLIENTEYTLKSGSTIVILNPTFLATLEPGTYVLSVFYGDTVETMGKFTLNKADEEQTQPENQAESVTSNVSETIKSNVNTADQTNTLFWAAWFVISMGVLAVSAIRKHLYFEEK
jgi:hypothetical protein